MKILKTKIVYVFSLILTLLFANYNADAQSIKVEIYKNNVFQTIDGFGASDA